MYEKNKKIFFQWRYVSDIFMMWKRAERKERRSTQPFKIPTLILTYTRCICKLNMISFRSSKSIWMLFIHLSCLFFHLMCVCVVFLLSIVANFVFCANSWVKYDKTVFFSFIFIVFGFCWRLAFMWILNIYFSEFFLSTNIIILYFIIFRAAVDRLFIIVLLHT